MVTISEGIGFSLALAMGFLTSFHCVGMCGGFVVSYTTVAAGLLLVTYGLTSLGVLPE